MKVAFLDRDGVINEDTGYTYRWEQFVYKRLVKTALLKLLELDYQLIIITNQSGIARGYYTEKDFMLLTKLIEEDLYSSGIKLLDVFYCPHHLKGKIEQYTGSCHCRKPQPGLFFQAFEKYNIDIDQSVMFGDQDSDMKAAKEAGIQHRFIIGDHLIINSTAGPFVNLKQAVDTFLSLENKNLSD